VAADMKSRFVSAGADPICSSNDKFGAFIRREFDKNAKVVKLAGMKVD
jgi:hypothetical protein